MKIDQKEKQRRSSSINSKKTSLNMDLQQVITDSSARQQSDEEVSTSKNRAQNIYGAESKGTRKPQHCQSASQFPQIVAGSSPTELKQENKGIDMLEYGQVEGVQLSGEFQITEVQSQVQTDTEDKIQKQAKNQSKVNEKKPLLFYVYGGNYPETVAQALVSRGNWQQAKEEENNIEKCNFVWRPFNYPAEVYKRIDKRLVRNSNPFVYNHLEVLKGLTTKSGLVRSLKQYYFNNDAARQTGYGIFDSTPTTFLLASGVEDAEHNEFVSRYKDISKGYAPKERIPIKHCMNNIWLVKPANANQGKGIEIFSNLDDILQFVQTRPQYTCCVVQKYVERPMLFKSRKFDIRLWALFTQKNEIFFYGKGYLRTSSDDYSLSNGNNYVHLTNNCLQKFGDNYGVHEDGNTIGFEALQLYLDKNFPQYKLNVQEHFVPRMKDLIIDSFLATKQQLNPNRRKNVFELLGYDFLIDEDFRIWMIEVNTNPYFGVPNGYIADLLPKMMDDLFKIVVDPVYAPDIVPENCLTPSGFELIYCEPNSTYSNESVNQRRPFSTSLYPVAELAQVVGHKAPKQDIKELQKYKTMNTSLSTYTYKQEKNKDSQKNSCFQGRSSSVVPSPFLAATTPQKLQVKGRSQSINKLNSVPSNQNATTTAMANQAKKLNSNITMLFSQKISQSTKKPTSDAHTSKPINKQNVSHFLTRTIQSNSIERINVKQQQKGDPRTPIQNSEKSRQIFCNIGVKNIITSNSSQEKYIIKGETNKLRGDSAPILFDIFFKEIITKVQANCTNLSLNQTTFELLGSLMKKDKIVNLYKDSCISALISLIIDIPLISKNVECYIIEMLVKISDKTQVRQILAKSKYISIITQKLIATENKYVQGCLLSILVNISSIKEIRNNQNEISDNNNATSSNYSPKRKQSISGVVMIKEQLLQRLIDKGILLIFFHYADKFGNILNFVKDSLTVADITHLISFLENRIKKQQISNLCEQSEEKITQQNIVQTQNETQDNLINQIITPILETSQINTPGRGSQTEDELKTYQYSSLVSIKQTPRGANLTLISTGDKNIESQELIMKQINVEQTLTELKSLLDKRYDNQQQNEENKIAQKLNIEYNIKEQIQQHHNKKTTPSNKSPYISVSQTRSSKNSDQQKVIQFQQTSSSIGSQIQQSPKKQSLYQYIGVNNQRFKTPEKTSQPKAVILSKTQKNDNSQQNKKQHIKLSNFLSINTNQSQSRTIIAQNSLDLNSSKSITNKSINSIRTDINNEFQLHQQSVKGGSNQYKPILRVSGQLSSISSHQDKTLPPKSSSHTIEGAQIVKEYYCANTSSVSKPSFANKYSKSQTRYLNHNASSFKEKSTSPEFLNVEHDKQLSNMNVNKIGPNHVALINNFVKSEASTASQGFQYLGTLESNDENPLSYVESKELSCKEEDASDIYFGVRESPDFTPQAANNSSRNNGAQQKQDTQISFLKNGGDSAKNHLSYCDSELPNRSSTPQDMAQINKVNLKGEIKLSDNKAGGKTRAAPQTKYSASKLFSKNQTKKSERTSSLRIRS